MYTIAMDMDGVVYPFEDAFNDLYTEFGGEYQPFDHWIDFSTLPGELVGKVWDDPRLFTIRGAYPNAQLVIQAIRTMPDTRMFFATSFGRREEAGVIVRNKLEWIQKQWPGFDSHDFIAIHAKWLLDTDMIVDDFPDHVRKWKNYHPEGASVLIRRPWNEDQLLKLERRGVIIVENGVEGVLSIIDEQRTLKLEGE